MAIIVIGCRESGVGPFLNHFNPTGWDHKGSDRFIMLPIGAMLFVLELLFVLVAIGLGVAFRDESVAVLALAFGAWKLRNITTPEPVTLDVLSLAHPDIAFVVESVMGELAQQVQAVTGEMVSVAFADQGYTGQDPAQAAQAQGIDLHIVKLPEAKKGFVLLPRRWVVERSFGWLNRFRRLTRDYERLPETLAGLHFVVFAMLMLTNMLPGGSS